MTWDPTSFWIGYYAGAAVVAISIWVGSKI